VVGGSTVVSARWQAHANRLPGAAACGRPVAAGSDAGDPCAAQPISVAIFSQLRQFGSNIELIAPASFISVAIPLCMFFAFRRYFAQGLLAGSVK
jgi:hypothetical protein